MLAFLQLEFLDRARSVVLLALRLYLGWFLVVGVWDNIVSSWRMEEFEAFLERFNCPFPEIAAPLSVWTQLVIGLVLIPGVFTRLAGLLMALNFTVAAVLLLAAGMNERQVYEPAILVFVGALLATVGAGPLSIDGFLKTRRGKGDGPAGEEGRAG